MKSLQAQVLAGAALMASFYGNQAASKQAIQKNGDVADKCLEQLGMNEPAGSEQLYLANIKQRTTDDLGERFRNKSVDEIEAIASELGYEVEWMGA
jgi:hypothetical protein